MTKFMEPSEIKRGDIVVLLRGVVGTKPQMMDVVSTVCGFATCRWLSCYTHTGLRLDTAVASPELIERYGIPKFNIFHTSDLVVVAVARETRIAR